MPLKMSPQAVAGLHSPCPKLTASLPAVCKAYLFYMTPPGCQSCLKSNTPQTIPLSCSSYPCILSVSFPIHTGNSIILFQVSYQHDTASAVISQDSPSGTKYPAQLPYHYLHPVPQAHHALEASPFIFTLEQFFYLWQDYSTQIQLPERPEKKKTYPETGD